MLRGLPLYKGPAEGEKGGRGVFLWTQRRAEVLPWQAAQPSGGPAARWGDGDGALLLCRCTLSGGTMAVYAGGAEGRMDEWGMAASVRCAGSPGRCGVPGG